MFFGRGEKEEYERGQRRSSVVGRERERVGRNGPIHVLGLWGNLASGWPFGPFQSPCLTPWE